MKIELYTTTIEDEQVTVEYDTLLDFEKQSNLAKEYIENKCNNDMPLTQIKEQAGVHGRVIEQTFQINDTLVMKRVWNYVYTADNNKNGIIKNIEYAMECKKI